MSIDNSGEFAPEQPEEIGLMRPALDILGGVGALALVPIKVLTKSTEQRIAEREAATIAVNAHIAEALANIPGVSPITQ